MLENNVQWLDLTSYLWPMLLGLPLAKTIGVHYKIIIKYSKACLTSFSPNYSWFMQYSKNDTRENGIIQLPLDMNFFYTLSKLIIVFSLFTLELSSFIQLLSFICSRFGLLFIE